jgi:aryl-alcohol dehydrogenase-like predicted oxidoreductase
LRRGLANRTIWSGSRIVRRGGALVKYRPLGATGLEVSEVGFGAWAIGGPTRLGGAVLGWGPQGKTQALRALQACPYQGINFIDTADIYGDGQSEELIGRAFRGKREQVLIATKVGNRQDSRGVWVKDFSPTYVTAAIEGCLRRLRTDYIDLLQLHAPPANLRLEGELLETLTEARTEGKILAWGVASGSLAQAEACAGRDGVAVVQLTHGLLERGAEARALPAAQAAGQGVLGRGLLAGGFLGGRHGADTAFSPDDWRSRRFPPEARQGVLARVEELQFLVRPDRSLAQAAIRFGLQQPGLSAVVVGARTPEQVQENAAACRTPELTAAERRRIDRLTRQG